MEVTKLSLLLKVLEGETGDTLNNQLRLFHERALPDLGNNIKCGNSLIGPDFYDNEQMNLLDVEEKLRINVFDWNKEFAHIMKAGGFDVVIGNPPYIRVGNISESVRPYLYERYSVDHRFDIYVAFVERGYRLLCETGLLGFILPNKMCSSDYAHRLRGLLSSEQALSAIVDFGDSQVFSDAMTYTCLLFLSRTREPNPAYIRAKTCRGATQMKTDEPLFVDVARLGSDAWRFVDPHTEALLARLGHFPTLGQVCKIERGLETGFDDFFFLQLVRDNQPDLIHVTSALEPDGFELERGVVRRLAKGAVDIKRYSIQNSGRCIFFPYESADGKPAVIPEAVLRRDFPKAWAYVTRHAAALRDRKVPVWYAYRRRNYDLADAVPRLLVPSIGLRACFALDEAGQFHFVGSGGGGGGGYALREGQTNFGGLRYLLGLLNSKLLDWRIKLVNSRFANGYYSFNRQYIEPVPIRVIDPSLKEERIRYEKMVSLVDQMLSLHRQFPSARTAYERDALQRQIDATDARIDRLVYELYGLTEEEIRIVEEATG